MSKLKHIFLGSFILSAFFLNNICQAGEETKQIKSGAYAGYNVLFVSFDALQSAHTSCLGYFRKTTPMIDHFAAEGFLFKNAISQSSWTVPATMSYITSLYPAQHRVVNKYSTYTKDEKVFSNLKKLSPGTITLAEILKDNGYIAGGFTGDAGVSAKFGFADGFDVYYEGPVFGGMDNSIPAALAWLKKNQKNKFFMFLHGYDVHGQFDPPAGFTKKYVNPPYTGKLKGGKQEEAVIREEGLENGSVLLTDEDVRFWRALYDEKISDLDARFAGFIEQLTKMGLLEKTVIILFSDHGTELYEHKRFDHGFSLYDELIHVPIIFWLPNTKGGVAIGDQVRAIDVMPTLLDFLGVKITAKAKKQMQGVSLIPLMQGRHMALTAFSETDYRFYASKRAIRTPDGLKFIYSMDTGKSELYDLKEDPSELNNLVHKEQNVAYELEQRLFTWLKSMGEYEDYYKKILNEVLKIKEY